MSAALIEPFFGVKPEPRETIEVTVRVAEMQGHIRRWFICAVNDAGQLEVMLNRDEHGYRYISAKHALRGVWEWAKRVVNEGQMTVIYRGDLEDL